MFAIGVGMEVNQDELEGIASPPDGSTSYVLNAEDFSALSDLLIQLAPAACDAITGETFNHTNSV